MRGWLNLAITLALTALPGLAPAPSSACFILPTREWAGYPADGAVNVPLDAIPIYWTPRRAMALVPFDSTNPPPSVPVMGVTATLRTEQGEQVELRPAQDRQVRFFEIAPRQLLAPATRYILTIEFAPLGPPFESGQDEISISFTTGQGLDDSDPTAPSVAIERYRATNVSSCDPGREATCIGLPADDFFVWHVKGEQRGGVTRGAFFSVQSSSLPPFDCLELQRRAPNGRLSQPTTVCAADAATYDLDQLQGERTSWLSVGCDERGLLLDDQPASQQLPPDQVEEPDPEQQPGAGDGDADTEAEEGDDAASTTAPREPADTRADPASCSAAARQHPGSAGWIVAGPALVLACRRRRQG